MSESRRDFLKESVSFGVALFLMPRISLGNHHLQYLTSSVRLLDGQYALGLVNLNDFKETLLPMNDRCHSMAISKKKERVVFFDRRPGERFHVFDFSKPNEIQNVLAPKKRRFYGHGVYSLDERLLYVAANDLETLEGKIIVYDANNSYRLVDEFSSGGIGPHEVVRHPNKNILYICNGGLKTHPNFGKEPFNVETMESNLSILDPIKGELLNKFVFSGQQLSLRHIDVNISGDAVVGFQDKDFLSGENKSLMGFYNEKKESFISESLSGETFSRAKGYVASVAVDDQSLNAVSTCPKGDMAILWNFKNKTIKNVFELKEASGVSFDSVNNRFLVTNGVGHIVEIKNSNMSKLSCHSFQWDNHAKIY